MQKLVRIYKPNDNDLNQIENDYLSKGWIVKMMKCINSDLILLLEKDTRKEKLQVLDDISKI